MSTRHPTSKKLVSLFLVFSLMTIGCATLGMRRQERFELTQKGRGAKVIITKTDGQQIKGELIAVKPNSLLLSGFPEPVVSVGIADIRAVRIVKKSKSLLGAGIGGAIGGGIGLYKIVSAYNASVERGEDGGLISYILLGSIVVPAALVVVGAFGGGIGALVGTDKVIYFTGMTDSEIQETLEYLHKKARIRDYR